MGLVCPSEKDWVSSLGKSLDFTITSMSAFNFVKRRSEHIPFISETGVEGKRLVLPVYAHSRLEVFPYSLLEKVSFTLLTDCLHLLERVSDFVAAATSEAEEKSVSTESDVVAHHSRIHPCQGVSNMLK